MNKMGAIGWMASVAGGVVAGVFSGMALQQMYPEKTPTFVVQEGQNADLFNMERLAVIVPGSEQYLYKHSTTKINIPKLLLHEAGFPFDFVRKLKCNLEPSLFPQGEFVKLQECIYEFVFAPDFAKGELSGVRPELSICLAKGVECASGELFVQIGNY